MIQGICNTYIHDRREQLTQRYSSLLLVHISKDLTGSTTTKMQCAQHCFTPGPQAYGQGMGRIRGGTPQHACYEHTVSTTVTPVCTDVSSGVVAQTRWLSIHISYCSYHKAILTRIYCRLTNAPVFLNKLPKKQILTLLLNTALY